MSSVRTRVICVGLSATLVAAGCGSSGSGATVGAGSGTTGADVPQASGTLSNGIKGERPGEEAATTLHLSAADCKALAALAEDRLGERLTHQSAPAPPHSSCRLEGHSTQITAILDTGFAANQRYMNRIEETVQFNTDKPAGLPRPVAHVGEKSYENSSASWIPALGSLLAVRGNRWLTVTIAVSGQSNRRLRAEAAVLTRAGFKLSADG